MLEDLKYLAERYSYAWPNLELIDVQKIGVPVVKMKIEVLGQSVTEISPMTEYILKFIQLGISNTQQISAALGIESELLTPELALEISTGRIRAKNKTDNFELTILGLSILTDRQAKAPKRSSIELIFDKTRWIMTGWDKQSTLIEFEYEKMVETPLKLPTKSKNTVKLNDFTTLDISRILKNEAKRLHKIQFEVLSIEKIITRRHAIRPVQILIYGDKAGNSEFLILVAGERSIDHEDILRAKGGLKAIGINVQPNKSSDDSSQIQITAEMDDGRLVRSFEHRPILLEALQNTRKRLLIVTPWITKSVIDRDFLQSLERLLQKKVIVTIAFGFWDESRSRDEKRRDDRKILKNLLILSERYANFEFRWMGKTKQKASTHAKILVSDDIYIAGSFNWLSFRGDMDRTYRKEDSEMRTKPSVVDSRYSTHRGEIWEISSQMTAEFLPAAEDKTK